MQSRYFASSNRGRENPEENFAWRGGPLWLGSALWTRKQAGLLVALDSLYDQF
jgi:hypothetical protein